MNDQDFEKCVRNIWENTAQIQNLALGDDNKDFKSLEWVVTHRRTTEAYRDTYARLEKSLIMAMAEVGRRIGEMSPRP